MTVLSNKTSWTITCTPLASVLDDDGRFEVNTVPLTSANLAAQTALLNTLETKLEALTLGVVAQKSIAITNEVNSGLPSSVALRGAKWKLQVQENGGNNRTSVITIPAALIASMLIPGTTQADFSQTAWIDFKAAFEAVAKSIAGNPLVLLGAAYESV
jgi:hypothetical protein